MNKLTSSFPVFFLLLVFLATSASAQKAQQVERSLPGGVKGLEQRVSHLEKIIGSKVESEHWYDRISIGGLVEVEAGWAKTDYDDPATEDEKSSEADLASVELAFDAIIGSHTHGHVMIKYEDDDLFIDEGYIFLNGTKALPAYLIAGKQYVPIGRFDSHFISDPETLSLAETNEGAIVAGYRINGDMLDISLGAFNGKVRESGDDDTIDSFVASVTVNLAANLACGVSYTSNLASADALFEQVQTPDNLDSVVAGWSAFVSFGLLEKFKFIAEYAAAMDSFKAGELYDPADAKDRKPSAWNLEIGFLPAENIEIAARYGGAEDGAGFLPEAEYGAVINWGFLENANLALEYLHGEFEDDVQKTDTVTAQLAVEF